MNAAKTKHPPKLPKTPTAEDRAVAQRIPADRWVFLRDVGVESQHASRLVRLGLVEKQFAENKKHRDPAWEYRRKVF